MGNITGNQDTVNGKYIGFNLDAFNQDGVSDKYFSTSGDYIKRYTPAGVQGLRPSSFNRKDGISLVEMFDVGILGMPTITAFYEPEDVNTAYHGKIAYRISQEIVSYITPNNEGQAIAIGGLQAYSFSIDTRFDSTTGEFDGIQSIADVFSIFSDNFKIIGHLLSNVSSSSSTADLGDLPQRVTTLENTLKITGSNPSTVIDRYNEILNWFKNVNENDTAGKVLIQTVTDINSAYVGYIFSGIGAPAVSINDNRAYIYGGNITLSHTTNETNGDLPTAPPTWPTDYNGSLTDQNLYTFAYYCSYQSFGTTGQKHVSTINLYGKTLNEAFATVLSNIQDISRNNTEAIIHTYTTLSDRISNSGTSGGGGSGAVSSVNGKTGDVTLTAYNIELYSSNDAETLGSETITYYNSNGEQITTNATGETKLTHRISDIVQAINAIAQADYKRDEWLEL